MPVEDNISLMRRWYREVWRERKNETIHELLASNAPLYGQTGPGEKIVGPDGFIAFAENIRNAFPDTELEIEDIFGVDDKVAVRWIAKGTHLGNFQGMEPSGAQVRISGMTIVHIENGKIAAGWDSWDRLEMMKQIGADATSASIPLAKIA